MKALDAISEEWRGADRFYSRGGKFCVQSERRNCIGDDDVVERCGCQGGLGLAGEKAMGRTGNYLARAMFQCRARSAVHRAAGGNQVVNHDDCCFLHIANQRFAAYDARASPLVHESLAHGPQQDLLQHLAKELGAFHAAWVRRDNCNRSNRQQIAQFTGEQAAGIEVDGPAAERVLERGDIVNIKGHDAVGSGGFKQAGHILRCYGIAGLGLAVFPRIGEIGHQRRDARRAIVAQGAKKEQQLAKLVVHALNWPSMEALQNINILAANADKWPHLMLAILEGALFMQTQIHTKVPGHLLAKWA